MARSSDSITLKSDSLVSLPGNTVGSGGNVVVENGHATGRLSVDLADDGGLGSIGPGKRMEFGGLTNTDQVAVKGGASYVVKFSWGA